MTTKPKTFTSGAVKPHSGQHYERVHEGKKDIMLNNFIGGITWAFGVTVGLALLFGILTLIARNINVVPVVGQFVSNILTFVLEHNPQISTY